MAVGESAYGICITLVRSACHLLGQAFFTLAFVCDNMASKEKRQAQLRVDLSNWMQRALFSLQPHEVEYLLQMSAQDCREMDDYGEEVTVAGIDEDLHDCQ